MDSRKYTRYSESIEGEQFALQWYNSAVKFFREEVKNRAQFSLYFKVFFLSYLSSVLVVFYIVHLQSILSAQKRMSGWMYPCTTLLIIFDMHRVLIAKASVVFNAGERIAQ